MPGPHRPSRQAAGSASRALMEIEPRRGRARWQGGRELGNGHTGPDRVTGPLHERPPLGTVRARAPPVQEPDGTVGRLVAQHLLEEGRVRQGRVQGDVPRHRPATAQGPPQPGTETHVQLRRQVGNPPGAPPTLEQGRELLWERTAGHRLLSHGLGPSRGASPDPSCTFRRGPRRTLASEGRRGELLPPGQRGRRFLALSTQSSIPLRVGTPVGVKAQTARRCSAPWLRWMGRSGP